MEFQNTFFHLFRGFRSIIAVERNRVHCAKGRENFLQSFLAHIVLLYCGYIVVILCSYIGSYMVLS